MHNYHRDETDPGEAKHKQRYAEELKMYTRHKESKRTTVGFRMTSDGHTTRQQQDANKNRSKQVF